jgi:mannose-1-phosphate guanylyltransferase / mannose-6-phosphate isomerase
MPLPVITPVILCGGFGERLWPLSRQLSPKQFTPLIDGRNLFDLTLDRTAALDNVNQVIAVGNDDHRFLMAESLRKQDCKWQILLEPVARNTAAAICAAALAATSEDGDPVLVILPSDHHIPDTAAFAATISKAVEAAQDGSWVTLGITPNGPSTQYGYIIADEACGTSQPRLITSFQEKPDEPTARQLLARGALWNAGIFVVKAIAALDSFRALQPEVFSACSAAWSAVTRDNEFVRLDKASFEAAPVMPVDIAIMEKSSGSKVIPFSGKWDDLGTWSAVASLNSADAEGNRTSGDVRLLHTRNSYIRSHRRLAVALGIEDAVIVDTADALLVAHKSRLGDIREVVSGLRSESNPVIRDHARVARPWGAYESLATGPGYQVKRITVDPGAALSLQYHHHRAEHWVVVSGTARVTRGEEVFELTSNQSTYIPLGEVHRLENPGSDPLELIEIQSGGYLGEDDIVRIDDVYGRKDDRAG